MLGWKEATNAPTRIVTIRYPAFANRNCGLWSLLGEGGVEATQSEFLGLALFAGFYRAWQLRFLRGRKIQPYQEESGSGHAE